jgi:demethylmenaquinone methyltransferase/2-methoxy-6-polyprenyl-1,4-benzoquinol methylase
VVATSERRQRAIALFEPLGPTYDRYASVLSFGQDPRWRRFLISRIEAGPGDRVLDVATGTGTVAAEVARRYGCEVVGLDQSPGMLAEAKRRAPPGVTFVHGDAERMPFDGASFDALTVTYLLRYVDDPAAALRELARVVRPGATLAALEFAVPRGALPRVAWELYVRFGLPAIGRTISPAWRDVGRFLGPSIRTFWSQYPLERQLELWRDAGVRVLGYRLLSFGGGIVIWGRRR